MFLQFGYPEHPRTCTPRLILTTIGLPHFSQTLSVTSGGGLCAGWPSPSRGREFLHSGNPEQPRNFPLRLNLNTIGRPHFSQTVPVSPMSSFTFRIVSCAWSKLAEKGV